MGATNVVTTIYAVEFWDEQEHVWTHMVGSLSSTDRKAMLSDLKKEYPHRKFRLVQTEVINWQVVA